MKNFDSLYNELYTKVSSRDSASSTVAAVSQGVHHIGKKIVEEAAEVWMAAEYQSEQHLAEEISQLLYWTQTLMLAKGVTLEQVYAYL